MFDSLNDKLGKVFTRLRGKGSLSEADVDTAMREIRVALLEADVALPVVKDFVEQVKAKAVGADVIRGVNPVQQVVKIVNDALIEMLGSETQELKFTTPPCAYLMVGLQGSGKTTSTAKIAKYLIGKQRKKVLMASLDIHRPAAQEQLRQLGEQNNIATLPIVAGENAVTIAKRAMDVGLKEGYDVVILDTAGRLSIDEELMAEVKAVRDVAKPAEILLVADAMTGQDAVNTAKAFDERLNITGVILTRIDGDARGGAALSMKAVTGKPVKLLGVGEKADALEQFHPDRMASRILGMGDVVSLVEKAVETVNREDAEKMARKFQKGEFDFNDLLSQMRQIEKMGGAGGMLKMLPGLGAMASQLEGKLDDKVIKHQEAIILSMTKEERAKPAVLNASRRKRIAAGCGLTVTDVNRLVKQQEQMQTMMKRMKKMGMGNMMGMMKGLMGSKDAAMLEGLDPDALAAQMGGMDTDDALGSNPFAQGTKIPPGINPFGGGNPFGGMSGMGGLGGMPPGMGFPPRGGKKKKR